jgi:hypothetical protein
MATARRLKRSIDRAADPSEEATTAQRHGLDPSTEIRLYTLAVSKRSSTEGKATDPEGTNATMSGSPTGLRDWLGRLFGIAVLLIVTVGPPLGSFLATDHLEPYEHVGWLWRSLAAVPVAVLFAVLGLNLVMHWVYNENIRALAGIYVVMYALPATLFGCGNRPIVNAQNGPS